MSCNLESGIWNLDRGVRIRRRLGGAVATQFFPKPLARQGLFDPFLFARLQVERMLLGILDDIFLLDFALEAP